jgi:hypothetical protein
LTTGEHTHCYCTQNAAGQVVCCVCGKPLEKLYDKPELVMMWEGFWHDQRKEERKKNEFREQNPRLF